MFAFTKKTKSLLPSDSTLPGRSAKMPVPENHFVNGNRIVPPFADGLEQERIDQAHDRRVVAAVQQVVDDGGLFRQRLEVVLRSCDVGGGRGLSTRLVAQDRVEAVVVHGLEGDVGAGDAADFQQGLERGRATVQAHGPVAAGDDHGPSPPGEGIAEAGAGGAVFGEGHGRSTRSVALTAPGWLPRCSSTDERTAPDASSAESQGIRLS